MDFLCPGYNQQLAAGLQKYYGQITVENSIQDIVALTKTGDLHVALYDLTHQHMYVANARGTQESGPQYAYDRQYVHFDLKALWNEPRPTV